MHFCYRKAKNSCFETTTKIIYGIFIANSRKAQHTHFEDKMLRTFSSEDKPHVVPACIIVILAITSSIQLGKEWSLQHQME